MLGFTLARYFGWTFARTILAVFGTMFCLIYVLDLVELLRRAGDVKTAPALSVAWLSLMRVPAIAEQVFPFAVLFGAMFTFLLLTRKLELVVARAAGVSAWQFMIPPLAVALALGALATAVYNPVSADAKQRAARLEIRLFGKGAGDSADTSLWLQQDGIDGQTILRAEASSDGGSLLSGVTAFVYDHDGSFAERVEADSAELHPGYWSLANAHVVTPCYTTSCEPPRDVGTDLIATNVSPEQVQQHFVVPDAVSFWSLPAIRDQTANAGLNAIGYELQYQSLLARPMLFVAMVLVAASFSLRFFRFGGVARMVAGGVAAGFVLYVATKVVADLGRAGLLSPTVAAWMPAVAGTMLGSLALLFQEDG